MPKENEASLSLRPFLEIEAILLDVASNSMAALDHLTLYARSLPTSTLNANWSTLEISILGLAKQFEMLEQKCQSLLTDVTARIG